MSNKKQPKAVERAIKSRTKGKQASPGARPMNRTGGGTPPSDTISNPKRISGVQRAMLAAACQHLGHDESGLLTDYLRWLIGMPGYEYTLLDHEQKRVDDAFNYAVERISDSFKLPRGVLNRQPKRPEPKRKPAPVETLRISSNVRRVAADPFAPTRQIDRVFQEEMRATTPKPTTPKPERKKLQPGVKALPQQRDTTTMARVAAATRR